MKNATHLVRKMQDGSLYPFTACNRFDLLRGWTAKGNRRAKVETTTNPAEVTCRDCKHNFYSEEMEAANG